MGTRTIHVLLERRPSHERVVLRIAVGSKATGAPVIVDRRRVVAEAANLLGLVFVAGDGALSALDAQTGALLWSSTRPSAGGTIGGIHWESPIVAGDSVYVCDEEQHLIAYTLQR